MGTSTHIESHRARRSGILLSAAAALTVSCTQSLAQEVLFTKDHGGSDRDGAYAIEATADGGFVTAGFSYTFSPDSLIALYVVKTDGEGALEWSRTYELSEYETHGAAIREVPGGGYAIAGRAGTNGEFDSFLLRVDAHGEEIWRRFYDTGTDDRAHALALGPEGGFVLAGQAWFGDELFGNNDLRVIKTDSAGHEEWASVFEYDDGYGAGADIAFSVEAVSDGGYVVAGYTQSSVWAGWLIKADGLGRHVWDQVYNYSWASDALRSVQELPDGGFILGGLFGNNQQSDVDLALVRTDALGEPIWTRLFGRVGHDEQGTCVRRLPDGGFVLAGMSASWENGWDMTVIRTDADGVQLWREDHGGESDDRAHSVAIGRDAIVAAGWAWSFGQGLGDVHLVAYGDPALGCDADFNGDGVADTLDVLAFLNAWTAGDPAADFNRDGEVNTVDVLAFLNAWTSGC